MTPDELISTIRKAGLIRIYDGVNWIDLRPVLVEFIEGSKLTSKALEEAEAEVIALSERLQNVANGTW